MGIQYPENMSCQKSIEIVFEIIRKKENLGEPASYIPELAHVNPESFGLCLSTIDNKQYCQGDAQEKFSIQSIAKVLSLSMAYKMLGGKIWERIGVEPSGTPFNSLVQLETDKGIPRNPFINAGALVICDILISELKNPQADFLNFVRDIADNPQLDYSHRIAESEKSVGYRNMALCYFIKSFGNIKNDPRDVLDFYFLLCSIEMTCVELSQTFLFLANEGRKTSDNKEVLTLSQAKRINAIMQTCGFYDESGEFAYEVGLPGKSGVGGGIIAISPKKYSIAVWSPRLNAKGNSYRGMKFLELFTTETASSIF
jgi:glutaminase